VASQQVYAVSYHVIEASYISAGKVSYESGVLGVSLAPHRRLIAAAYVLTYIHSLSAHLYDFVVSDYGFLTE